jgi:hypothetical protein
MNVTVKNTNGGSLGPFNIYYDAVDPGLLLASNVSSASLAQGVNLTVSDAATSIVVVNTRSGCGSQQQTLTLPPPVIPINYKDVTVQARLLSATTEPTTASVYYKIDNSPFRVLGDFWDTACTSYSPIQVPENSTLVLGIMSGSVPISFEASGSSFLCSNPAGVQDDYCGTDNPFYLFAVKSDTTVSMYAEVDSGVIVNCGPPPPPPPPPPTITTNMVLNIFANQTQLRTVAIYRVRGGDFDTLYATGNPANERLVQIPIMPGDSIIIDVVTPGDGSVGYIQVIDTFPDPDQTIYITPNRGKIGGDRFNFTVPTDYSTSYVVNVGHGFLP